MVRPTAIQLDQTQNRVRFFPSNRLGPVLMWLNQTIFPTMRNDEHHHSSRVSILHHFKQHSHISTFLFFLSFKNYALTQLNYRKINLHMEIQSQQDNIKATHY